jgi:hypothetical protein
VIIVIDCGEEEKEEEIYLIFIKIKPPLCVKTHPPKMPTPSLQKLFFIIVLSKNVPILELNVIKLENVYELEMWCCARSTHRRIF